MVRELSIYGASPALYNLPCQMTGRRMKTIEIQGFVGGSYIIFDLSDRASPLNIASTEQLRADLRRHGVTEQRIDQALDEVGKSKLRTAQLGL